MKYTLGIIAVALTIGLFPLQTLAEDCPPDQPCGYTTRITYEIIDSDGVVKDSIVETLSWSASALQAVKHKYLLFNHIYSIRSGETEPALVDMVRKLNTP